MNGLDRPIFIVGLPRSGSTVWHNIFAMSPKICRLTEMLYLTPWRRDFRYFLRNSVGNLKKKSSAEKMVNLMLSGNGAAGLTGAFWRFENFPFVKQPEFRTRLLNRVESSDRSLGSLFRAVIEEVTTAAGLSRCCVKFPVWVNHVEQLMEWYPNCRVVHITRDPRAVAMSKTGDPSGAAVKISRHPRLASAIRLQMIFYVIVQYRWASRVHVRFRNQSNYALFSYESLLDDPESTIRELCDFAQIKFHPDMADPGKGEHEHQPSSLTMRRNKSLDRSAAWRWREVIRPHEKTFINFFTAGAMKSFGYDPELHPINRWRE